MKSKIGATFAKVLTDKDHFEYIQNDEKQSIKISEYKKVLDSMTDEEFIDYMIAAFSPESMALRDR